MIRHCEARSNEAIHAFGLCTPLDCLGWIATSDIHPPRPPRRNALVLIRPEMDVIIDNMRPREHKMLQIFAGRGVFW